MTGYKWACQACGHVNAPEITHCEKCNCPAHASGIEIDKYKQLTQGGSPQDIRELFTASTLKLVVMSLCTFSLYVIYWFYKNWHLIKKQTPNSRVMPVLRAFFSPIFAYSCFSTIKSACANHESNKNLPVGYLAIIFVVINLMSRLPDPYGLLGILTFLPLVPVNNAALAVNLEHNPHFQNNEKFSTLNKVAIWVGGLLWLLVLLGSMVQKNA